MHRSLRFQAALHKFAKTNERLREKKKAVSVNVTAFFGLIYKATILLGKLFVNNYFLVCDVEKHIGKVRKPEKTIRVVS